MPAILDTRQLPRVDRIAAAAFLEHTDTPIRLASNAAEQLGRRFSGWQRACRSSTWRAAAADDPERPAVAHLAWHGNGSAWPRSSAGRARWSTWASPG